MVPSIAINPMTTSSSTSVKAARPAALYGKFAFIYFSTVTLSESALYLTVNRRNLPVFASV